MRILLIKPGAIGDLLQLSPVVRALRGMIPSARVTLLVGDRASADLFRHNPSVEEVLVYDRRGTHRSARAFVELWKAVRRRRFRLVLHFQRSNLKAWLLATAALPARVLVYRKARRRTVHAVENHLETVAPLGIDPRAADRRLELFLGDEDERWAEAALAGEGLSGRPLAALNLGASHAVNRWPAGHFAALAERLHAELGCGVLLVGGPQDRELAEAARAMVATPMVDLVGRTTLLQLGAVLKRCAVAVSGDTGPMHLATAVGTRVIALFGAADPARTGPVGDGHRVLQAAGVPCVPCRSRTCRHVRPLECMERISVEEVFSAVADMVATGGSGAGKALPEE
jgi:heptosyltransferase II